MRFITLSMVSIACGGLDTDDDHPKNENHGDSGFDPDQGGNEDGDEDGDADTDTDTDADTDTDTDADTDADLSHLEPGEFVGDLNATFIIDEDGSIGGPYEGSCPGAVSFIINPDGIIDGDGQCTTDILTMGFWVVGTQDGHNIDGELIAESGGESVSTPFSGSRYGGHVEANFDTTHVNEGETLRLHGVLSADRTGD